MLVIPTNRALLRVENPDVVYRTEKEKYFAAADEIQKTARERNSPYWSARRQLKNRNGCRSLLKKKGIKHVVLNAKYHEREAEIVAQAGRKGMVTIATNMAGRGTDILLGGNPEVHGQAGMREKRHRAAGARRAGQDRKQWTIRTAQPGITRAMNLRSRRPVERNVRRATKPIPIGNIGK